MAFRPLVICWAVLTVSVWSTAVWAAENTNYDSRSECEGQCVGDHDADCVALSGDARFTCRCRTQYYAIEENCEHECSRHNDLFVYGRCYEFPNEAPYGVCRFQCEVVLRLWTTIFVFALVAAVAIIITAVIPGSIIVCLVYAKLRRRLRFSNDIQLSNGDLSNRELPRFSQMQTVGPTSTGPLRSWNYGYHDYYSNKLRD